MQEQENQHDRRHFLKSLIAGGSALALGQQAKLRADEVPKPVDATKPENAKRPELNDARKKAVLHCMDVLRSYQLENGAIDIRSNWNPQDIQERGWAEQENDENGLPAEKLDYVTRDSIRVVPYFANYAAMGMLSGYENVTHDVKDLEYVAKWMKFYADHQEAPFSEEDRKKHDELKAIGGAVPVSQEGYIYDYHGSRHAQTFFKSDQIDAVDSYASTFLQLADRYHDAIVKCNKEDRARLDAILPPEKLYKAAKSCVKAIDSVTDPDSKDGLTWAKDDYRVKYLMDNIEVYGGLRQAEHYFKAYKPKEFKEQEDSKAIAEACAKHAARIAKALPEYWRDDNDPPHFAWCKQVNHVTEKDHWDIGSLRKTYPDVMANLFALAWIPEKPEKKYQELFTEMKKRFKLDDPGFKNVDERAPLYNWAMAAANLKDTDASRLEDRLVEQMQEFPKYRNAHRLGLAMLTLMEGRSWMPSIADAQPEKSPEKTGESRGK